MKLLPGWDCEGGEFLNSKKKGSAGEREFLHLLEERGVEARRNEQRYVGGLDNPDISAQLGGVPIHFEIKRAERFRLYDALEQAQRDANGHALPVVAHRQNRRPWVVVMTLEDFLSIMKGGCCYQPKNNEREPREWFQARPEREPIRQTQAHAGRAGRA